MIIRPVKRSTESVSQVTFRWRHNTLTTVTLQAPHMLHKVDVEPAGVSFMEVDSLLNNAWRFQRVALMPR